MGNKDSIWAKRFLADIFWVVIRVEFRPFFRKNSAKNRFRFFCEKLLHRQSTKMYLLSKRNAELKIARNNFFNLEFEIKIKNTKKGK